MSKEAIFTMTIEEMKKRKKELGFTNQMIADKCGVPLSTVQKIFSGATKTPRHKTLKDLEALLSPQESGYIYPEAKAEKALYVEESRPAYNARKQYTIEDYFALPDDQRVELIDGVFYDMTAQTTVHQSICGFIHNRFLDHILKNKGPCYPFISPVDVQLDCDDKTMVQPDVLIVCDRDKCKKGRIYGAPDLIAEVLSPATRRKDISLKLYKYMNAGVREYWIIDPKSKKVLQYDLEHDEFPVIYTFGDKVPVLIWHGACEVDFKELYEATAFLWDYEV